MPRAGRTTMGKATDKEALEDQICQIQSGFCSIFSNSHRIRVLFALKDSERTVTELSEIVGISLQNLSQHLRVMRDKGCLTTRKEGKSVYYRIANPKFVEGAMLIREGIMEELEKQSKLV